MPIKPMEILLSRLLAMMTLEVASSLVIALPAISVWAYKGFATPFGIIAFCIGFALMPFLSTAVALLLAWLLSGVSSKLRHKNLISIGLSLAFLLAYFYGVNRMQSYFGELILRGVEIAAAFRRAMPPLYAFGVAIADGNLAQALFFALWALLPFCAAVFLLSLTYQKILTRSQSQASVKYKGGAQRESGVTFALVTKELARVFSSPTVVLNCSLGSIFALGGAAYAVVQRAQILAGFAQLSQLYSGITAPGVAAAALLCAGTMNNLSASLLSLEGQNLWIAKSIPVRAQTILLSKVYAHLTLTSLPVLLASLIVSAVLASSIADLIALILIPQPFLVFLALTGLIVNLVFPKLDWLNEAQVVKQSLPAGLSLLGAMAIVAGLFVLYVALLRDKLSLMAYLWAQAIAFALLSAAAYIYLSKAGTKRFEEL